MLLASIWVTLLPLPWIPKHEGGEVILVESPNSVEAKIVGALNDRERAVRTLSVTSKTYVDGKYGGTQTYQFKQPNLERVRSTYAHRWSSTIVVDGKRVYYVGRNGESTSYALGGLGFGRPFAFEFLASVFPYKNNVWRTFMGSLNGKPMHVLERLSVSSHLFRNYIFVDPETGWPVAMKQTPAGLNPKELVLWEYYSILKVNQPIADPTFRRPRRIRDRYIDER